MFDCIPKKVVAKTGPEDIGPGIKGAISGVISFFKLQGRKPNRSVNYLPGIIQIPIPMKYSSLLLHLFKKPGARIGRKNMKSAGRQ